MFTTGDHISLLLIPSYGALSFIANLALYLIDVIFCIFYLVFYIFLYIIILVKYFQLFFRINTIATRTASILQKSIKNRIQKDSNQEDLVVLEQMIKHQIKARGSQEPKDLLSKRPVLKPMLLSLPSGKCCYATSKRRLNWIKFSVLNPIWN